MKSWSLVTWLGAACLAAGSVGCANHHGNTYAYAPPYAPPVYPQPAAVAQPVSYAAPVAAAPAVATAAPMVPNAVVTGAPCPQACPDGTVVGTPVVVEGGGQTPPCPPGP